MCCCAAKHAEKDRSTNSRNNESVKWHLFLPSAASFSKNTKILIRVYNIAKFIHRHIVLKINDVLDVRHIQPINLCKLWICCLFGTCSFLVKTNIMIILSYEKFNFFHLFHLSLYEKIDVKIFT